MQQPTDAVATLSPALAVGERVSLRVETPQGRTEVIGFVTALSHTRLGVVDRRGVEHDLDRAGVDALRRVPLARGRRPDAAPRDLLDDLADRAGATGTPWVARIVDLLADRTPPASVPPWGERGAFGDVRARFEGEWVTLPTAPLETVLDAAWWATRMGARSVQLRGEPPAGASGFVPIGDPGPATP